jgi:hypothetical protein
MAVLKTEGKLEQDGGYPRIQMSRPGGEEIFLQVI